jgi:hypothetical protein
MKVMRGRPAAAAQGLGSGLSGLGISEEPQTAKIRRREPINLQEANRGRTEADISTPGLSAVFLR